MVPDHRDLNLQEDGITRKLNAQNTLWMVC
jgi:hypothetical protein